MVASKGDEEPLERPKAVCSCKDVHIIKSGITQHRFFEDGRVRKQELEPEYHYSVWNLPKEKELPFPSKIKYYTFRSKGKEKTVRLSSFNPTVANVIIRKFCKTGDLILDPFCGGFTKGYYAIQNGCRYKGFDVNKETILENISLAESHHFDRDKIGYFNLDGCVLKEISDSSSDFIFTCPPYWNLEDYGDQESQLCRLSYDEFFERIDVAFQNFYRVLKPDKYCVIVVGDKREKGLLVPLHKDFIHAAQKSGFGLYDHIILNKSFCMAKALIWTWVVRGHKFTGRSHEYCQVFKKEKSVNSVGEKSKHD